MPKKKTISTRYKEWVKEDPFWAYACLFCFGLVFVGLMIHLGVLHGIVRKAGLIVVLVGDAGAIAISTWKKQYWWAWFFGFITFGVVAFEIASYFFGGA